MQYKEERPKLKIPQTKTDNFAEVIGWSILASIWIMINYSDLPNTIPIHNNKGIIDGYGHKSSIWILPLVASILFIGMTLLNRLPHAFNYLIIMTKGNASQQYIIATRILRYVKITLVIIIGFLTWKTIQIAIGAPDGLGEGLI